MGTGNDYEEDGVLVKNIPMKALTMLEEQGEAILRDIHAGRLSKTSGLPILFFDLKRKQLIVDDGNHRIFQKWLQGHNTFDAIVYSSEWHNTLRPVYEDENKFDWDESYREGESYGESIIRKMVEEVLSEELIGTSGGVRYFQMGGTLPKQLYNRKNNKPSRDVGSSKFKGKKAKDSAAALERKRKQKKRWYEK